jgi:iron-sulfur cluster repair protein YtfE (RIC family)
MPMLPCEARTRVLYEHRLLRERIDLAEDLVHDLLESKSACVEDLYRQMGNLARALHEHLQLEERLLLPFLRASGDGVGTGLACFERAHAMEREALDLMGHVLETRSRSPLELALLVRGFLEMIREDMAEEETWVLRRALYADSEEQTA